MQKKDRRHIRVSVLGPSEASNQQPIIARNPASTCMSDIHINCWDHGTAVQNSRKSDMRPRVRVQVNQLCFFKFFKFFAESLNFAILTHVSNPSILPRHVAHTPLRTPSPGAAGARENADNSIARTIFFLRFVFLLEPFPVLRVCLF